MLPVILGSDWNVYGVAFSFYQKYHIHSFALGMRHQRYTDHLDFLTVETDTQFMDPRRFLEILLQFAERHRGEDLLLIPCSDYYMRYIVENREQLRKFYRFNVIDLSLYQQLESKIDFYRLCE
ncbi:MAG: carboxylate--amine ligase, partial [Peptoniphilaceae bacterium]|nr:carboxylate--amine ligase [Peptoniphilaceae bacterium]MDY5765973.1 carboxylate--amine ligase [Peptoniphilaceae bacterium]